jgi:hypothetical protein
MRASVVAMIAVATVATASLISQPARAVEGCYVVRATADARNPRVSTERAEHRLHRHILHEMRNNAGKSIGPVHTHCIRNACEASALVCHH